MVDPLKNLRQSIERLERRHPEATPDVLPFDCAPLDQHLPHGGLDRGALHEIEAASGVCHETAATLFIAGILARMPGHILWCVKMHDLFAPGLALVGLDAERVIFAEAGDEKNILIAMEEGLRHSALAAVVGEVTSLPLIAARRLHLAARTSGVTAFVLHRQARFKKKHVKEPTSAVTRWCVTGLPSHSLESDGIGRPCWQIELMRCRDAEQALWIVEACDEKGCLGIPSDMVYRQNTDEAQHARVG